MKNLMIGTAAFALAVSGSALAAKPDKEDRGKGRAEASARVEGGRGGANVRARAEVRADDRKDARQQARVQAARAEARQDARRDAQVRAARADARQDRREDVRDRREDIRDRREDLRDRREDIIDRREDLRDRRDVASMRRDRDDDGRDWSWARRDRDRVLITGCPPGLAKKDNGCMPPGLAKKVNWQGDRDWDRGWYGYRYRPALFGIDRYRDGRFYYDDGYLFRIGDGGRVSGYLPLLGGALAIGNPWPASYASYDVPSYYVDYYGLGSPDSYRFADNVLYRVDPQDSAIMSVAALLTGDEFLIGQQVPVGYDVYNVPYPYRDRYYDTPDTMYRYSDGYVYRIDPKTMLVAAAIDLVV